MGAGILGLGEPVSDSAGGQPLALLDRDQAAPRIDSGEEEGAGRAASNSRF